MKKKVRNNHPESGSIIGLRKYNRTARRCSLDIISYKLKMRPVRIVVYFLQPHSIARVQAQKRWRVGFHEVSFCQVICNKERERGFVNYSERTWILSQNGEIKMKRGALEEKKKTKT